MVASGGHVPLLPPLGSGTDNIKKTSAKFLEDLLVFQYSIQIYHHLNLLVCSSTINSRYCKVNVSCQGGHEDSYSKSGPG